MSVTSAARVISASAAPKRMADSRFHAARGDHHAVVAEGAAGDRRRLVVARMMDRGHGCDLAGREPGLLKYRCLGPAADDQMAFGAQFRERGEQANAVSGARGTRYRHYDPHSALASSNQAQLPPFAPILITFLTIGPSTIVETA